MLLSLHLSNSFKRYIEYSILQCVCACLDQQFRIYFTLSCVFNDSILSIFPIGVVSLISPVCKVTFAILLFSKMKLDEFVWCYLFFDFVYLLSEPAGGWMKFPIQALNLGNC